MYNFTLLLRHSIFLFLLFTFGVDACLCLYSFFTRRRIQFDLQMNKDYLSQQFAIAFAFLPLFLFPYLAFVTFLNIRTSWIAYVPYLIYTFLDRSPFTGGSSTMFLRYFPLWTLVEKYFPVVILKDDPSQQYTADRPYLFGYHPVNKYKHP